MKFNLYGIILGLISLIIVGILYQSLPDTMPIHWGVNGEVDGYGPKAFAAFLPVVLIFSFTILADILPKIDPRKKNYENFSRSYRIVINSVITFFFMLHISIIVTSLGFNIEIDKVITFAVGILFIIIGNYLPKSRSNFFLGIRTPWTLSSDTSWQKTHRLGGKLFLLGGIIISVSSLVLTSYVLFIIVMIVTLTISIIPVVMSYFYMEK